MATPTKDRITCHVLDTSIGRPARGVRVKLELTHTPVPSSSSLSSAQSSSNIPAQHHAAAAAAGVPGPVVFESQTDNDGRVHTWLPYSSSNASGEVPVYTLEDVLGGLAASSAAAAADGGAAPSPSEGGSRWTLRFDTGAYFAERGTETFFPEVAVVFRVEENQHYHVPLLLAPYSYSTYRGS